MIMVCVHIAFPIGVFVFISDIRDNFRDYVFRCAHYNKCLFVVYMILAMLVYLSLVLHMVCILYVLSLFVRDLCRYVCVPPVVVDEKTQSLSIQVKDYEVVGNVMFRSENVHLNDV